MSRGEDSESVNGGQLRAFIERVERMQEERKAISDDIAEIYAEAKGNGFDTKVMRTIVRIRTQDHNERMEQEAILDLYMAALGMQAAPRDDDADGPPAPARARASTMPTNSATPGGPADGAEPDLAPVSSATPPVDTQPAASKAPMDTAAAQLGDIASQAGGKPAPLAFNPRRPLCKRPEMCGGYGPRHCGADGLTCQATAAMAVTAGGTAIEHQGAIG